MSAWLAPLLGSCRSSVQSHVTRSVELKLEPMWPEPACMIMKSVLMRQRSANTPARASRIGDALSNRTKRLARHERQMIAAD